MSYACFTVSYYCIGHYVVNYYVDIINRQFGPLFRQTNAFARSILNTNFVYLKASADQHFWRKLGDEAMEKMNL